MERVSGIGGFFFRAQDPATLSAWYEQHLGIMQPPATYEEGSWWQDEGPTVFSAYGADSTDINNPSRPWVLNLRVRDLDAMVAQLRNAGITVEVDPEVYPNGRFARLHDPEGNPIELWQAGGTDALRPAGR
ncbi:MAG: VOC family protein [Caldilineaceae bacterium]